MKLPISVKFIVSYVVLALAGFLLLNTTGVRMIEDHLYDTDSTAMYRSASALANSWAVRSFTSEEGRTTTYDLFKASADSLACEIMLIDTKGNIVLDSSYAMTTDPVPLTAFDPAALKKGYYAVGAFYGHFDQDHLSVMVPIIINMSTRGYIAVHKSSDTVLSDREALLWVMLKFYLLIVLLFFALILLLVRLITSPLRKITRGADEFAAGNLDYQIKVSRKDEMGYLSQTLNYMAGELKQTDQFQKNFISNVSHDFRSPLTSIKGYVEAILDGTIPPSMQNHYLEIVLSETARLTKLTQSMLQLNDLDAKAYMLNIRDFDLHQMIKNTAASFEGLCRQKRITIQLLLASSEAFVSADEEKIQQVLYNLIDNAIKFSPSDSSITIETTTKGEKLFVSVKDQGCGIPGKDLSKIWNRFYKQDISRGKDRTGTGLGLSIVKEIINTHKQTINVVSTQGAGTEFTFTLARAQSAIEADASLENL